MILGKTKMISYENLEEARAKRAAKKKATVNKGKRGLKRKSLTPETETEVEAQAGSPKVVTNLSMPKEKVTRKSEIEIAKTLEAL